MSTPDDAHEWLPVADAARRLDVSASTVLRMIRDGQLVAELGPRSERDRRPQYLVRFDRPQPPPASTPDAATSPQEPSTAYLDAVMQMAEQVAELREERGRLTAERDAAISASDDARTRLAASEAREAALTAEIGTLRAELERATRRPWWRRILSG